MMWAQSTHPHSRGRSHLWHRVTVAAWNAQALVTACGPGGHVLQRRHSAVRTEPPPTDRCARCLHALGRCAADCPYCPAARRARRRA